MLLVGVALFAWAGWARAGRLARKLDALNQSYWELRYDYTRLRSQIARLDPEQAGEAAETTAASAGAAQAPPSVSFVPLSSIKRKEQ